MTRTPKELLVALHSLLDQALDLDPAARATWLARLRIEQPALAAEVDGLLASEAVLDAEGFLAGRVQVEAAPEAPGLAGWRLGAYKLERPLGRGGMGSVWFARRCDGRYEGTAAVKLLNLALLDSVGSARFRREGTALARLGHRNIARLLDAGISDGDLVLEYVDGIRIDRYCDAESLHCLCFDCRRSHPTAWAGRSHNYLAALAHWYGKCHSIECSLAITLRAGSFMAKPPQHRAPDPLAGVVDRLLAQLPGLQSTPNSSTSRPRAADPWTTPVPSTRADPALPTPAVGAWGRVFLALVLGTMMASWPYRHTCGLPLAGYLGAIGTVIVSGAWAAAASWRYRAALAHTVSLLILFYGFVLGAAELLPRTGYAASRAFWQCEDTTLR